MDAQISIPDEFRRQLDDQPGHLFRFRDSETKRVYFVSALSDDGYLRHEIDLGIDSLERGEVEKWEIDSLLAELNREHAERSSS